MTFLRLMLMVLAVGFSANCNAIQFMGVPSCGEWVNRHSTNDGAAMEEWLLGFLSGLAAGKNIDLLKKVQKEYLYLWIDNYCQANPSGRVDNAAHDLADQLSN